MKNALVVIFLGVFLMFGGSSGAASDAAMSGSGKCKPSSNTCYLVIKIDVKNGGNLVGIDQVDDDGTTPAKVVPGPSSANKKSVAGVENVHMLKTESSPGCVYYYFGGTWYQVCS